jgi:uncharacterized protein (DUF433 family)
MNEEEIVRAFPDLEREDIREALHYLAVQKVKANTTKNSAFEQKYHLFVSPP